uniref:GPN-loop GTPase 2 n=1 Tax=Sarcophilus harrisii TaxID=9305 RepID=A0A7N4UWZ8_SARHA
MRRGHRRTGDAPRRDGGPQAGAQRRPRVLHGVPGGQPGLAARPPGAAPRPLPALRLPGPGGTVHAPRRLAQRLRAAGPLGLPAFNLDYYTEVLDLSYLLDHLASDPFFRHYRQLNEKLVQLIEDYSLVSFIPLNIQDKESVQRVLQAVDKANGYCFGVAEQRSLEAMMSAAVGADFHFTSTLGIQEKYLQSPEEEAEEQEDMHL